MKSFKYVIGTLCLMFVATSAFAQGSNNPITVANPTSPNYYIMSTSSDSIQINFTSTARPPQQPASFGCGSQNALPNNPMMPMNYVGACMVQVMSGKNCGTLQACSLAGGQNPMNQGGAAAYTFNGTDGRTIIVTIPSTTGTNGGPSSMMHH